MPITRLDLDSKREHKMENISKSMLMAVLLAWTFTANAGQKMYFIHSDHLNTPQVLTNSAQQVVWKVEEQMPFGEVEINQDVDGDNNDVVFNLRFPGQYYDVETGTNYNYYRTYDPSTGRYIQSDPIGLAGGINTYMYVEGNPITYDDPSGLCGEGLCVGGIIIGLRYLAGQAFKKAGKKAIQTAAQAMAAARQREYERPKEHCDKKPQPSGDICSDLSREIDHYENCANWYEWWDDKWLPGRHKTKI